MSLFDHLLEFFGRFTTKKNQGEANKFFDEQSRLFFCFYDMSFAYIT
jgi:hypothetical protein